MDISTSDATRAPRRVLGPWQASSVVIGMVVGAGIFRSASVVAASLQNDWLILAAWAVGGVFALAGALCYAELSSAFPHQGGDYRFLREAFGGWVAFLFAWSRFAIIFTASAAMLAFVAADYLASLVPMGSIGRAGVAATTIVGLTALNLRGLKTGVRSQVAMVTLDVGALLALGAAAAWLIASDIAPASPPAPAQPFAPGAFGSAMVFVMLAYGGFNDSATLSAEVRCRNDMTRALVGGMSAVTALYLLANWAYLRGLGVAGLAASDAPAADLMRVAFGPVGESLMVAAVGIAALAVINALVIVGGRTLYAVAADEPGLARIAQWDQLKGVPRAAIWVQCAFSLLLVGWGTATRGGFATMVDYMAPVYWLFLTLTGLALLILRRSRPDVARPYRTPLFPLTPLLVAAGSAYVLVSSILYVGWIGCGFSFGALASGFIARRIVRPRDPDRAADRREPVSDRP